MFYPGFAILFEFRLFNCIITNCYEFKRFVNFRTFYQLTIDSLRIYQKFTVKKIRQISTIYDIFAVLTIYLLYLNHSRAFSNFNKNNIILLIFDHTEGDL